MKCLITERYTGILAALLIFIVAPHLLNGQSSINKMRQMTNKTVKAANSLPEESMVAQRPEDISPLLIGEKVPKATLTDMTGKNYDLDKAIARQPTILVFYRGGWCPYCSKQLSGLQQLLPELKQMGYQLLAVSTDKPEGLAGSAEKQQLDYTLLSDADLSLSKQFGIAYKAPEDYWKMLPETTGGQDKDLLLPVPSVFILDRKGVIQFEYINPDFRQRLNPALLKAVATSLKSTL
jgi:peroxiredoxin